MHSKDLRRRFIDFFVKKHGHAEISGASLVPENDPTVLFTTAGMHPLVPYLMGEAHPSGRRLVDAQKCVRTDDIDEVGDATHLTFFEMMGNWSLGERDYFKKEAIEWSYEFLTTKVSEGGIGLDPNKLCVSCFEGDKDAPKDEEAAGVWESLGFVRNSEAKNGQKRRIFFYGKKENWWGPAGQTGPCGPDTEMFYYTGDATDPYEAGGPASAGRPAENNKWVEIWNDVFMQYNKTSEGTFIPLKQQNVDTGLGLERVTAILQNAPTIFETDLFAPVMKLLAELVGKPLSEFSEDETLSSRIVADHLRAATFVLADPRAVRPSNTDQGYVLRRLIRRAVRHGMKLGISGFFTVKVADVLITIYKEVYGELARNFDFIRAELQKEEDKFHSTLEQGLKEINKLMEKKEREIEKMNTLLEVKDGQKIKESELYTNVISGEEAFYIYETYGFPLEMIEEETRKRGFPVSKKEFQDAFQNAFKAHQEKSRAGATQKFHGGLADSHEETVKLHTATHLLHQALRDVLGSHVYQQGSNITQERLRFDFTHPEKMTPEQLAAAEAKVNEAIAADIPVFYEMMTVDEAKKRNAIGLFPDRYDEKIKVYVMDRFSTEICGGPHVSHTGVLGKFKIKKEESCAAGIRRIKAVVSDGASGFEFAGEKKA